MSTTRVTVKILTSKGCKLCNKAKDMLRSAAKRAWVELDLVELSVDGEGQSINEAVDYAIEKNLSHVPSFIIGDRVFIENLFTEEELMGAFHQCRYSAGDHKISG